MKLLLDQNISFRLSKKIQKLFPGTAQVQQLGLYNSSDIDIWKYAGENGFTILTFDADFFEFANIHGPPPKIIWIRRGNCSTEKIEKIIKEKYEEIRDFILEEEFNCLTIT